MKYFILSIFILKGFFACSQIYTLGDTVTIEFIKRPDVVAKVEKDLNYQIVLMNISSKPVYIYAKLVYDISPNIMANFDSKLFRKNNDKYEVISNYPSSAIGYYSDSLYQIYGTKSDSVLMRFDISKKILNPHKSDTLSYNVLIDHSFIIEGIYKFQALLRINTHYVVKNGNLIVNNVEYIGSDQYYFQVPQKLVTSKMISDKN